jgi:hypothetical protein
MRVVICDDDHARGRDDWAQRVVQTLSPGHDVDVQVPETYELAAALAALETRSAVARQASAPGDTAEDDAEVIDSADILLVDYDLTPDSTRPAEATERELLIRSELRAQTAETVAYLARCSSSCKAIMIINQSFRERTFDLTMTKFIDSRAEVNVSHEDVASPELWTGQGDGFRPSAWPRLIDAPEAFEHRLGLVQLDAPVLETLGLLPLETSGLDVRQLDVLGDRPAEVTFRDLARAPELGLTGKDEAVDDEGLRRIAAAGVGRWLDSTVLPSQSVIVDAQHLLVRFPSLLPGDPEDPATWELLASHAYNESLAGGILDGARIGASDWFPQPVWFWPKLASNTAIAEVARPWSAASYDWVFCEDLSRFRKYPDAREVGTDLPGPYPRRFIAQLAGVHYVPRNRILG